MSNSILNNRSLMALGSFRVLATMLLLGVLTLGYVYDMDAKVADIDMELLESEDRSAESDLSEEDLKLLNSTPVHFQGAKIEDIITHRNTSLVIVREHFSTDIPTPPPEFI